MLFPYQVEPLHMKMFTDKKTKAQLFGHRDCCIIAHCTKKFRDISRLIANVFLLNLKISMFYNIPRGTVAWKQWTRL